MREFLLLEEPWQVVGMRTPVHFSGHGVDAGSDTIQRGNAVRLNLGAFPWITQCLLVCTHHVTAAPSQEPASLLSVVVPHSEPLLFFPKLELTDSNFALFDHTEFGLGAKTCSIGVFEQSIGQMGWCVYKYAFEGVWNWKRSPNACSPLLIISNNLYCIPRSVGGYGFESLRKGMTCLWKCSTVYGHSYFFPCLKEMVEKDGSFWKSDWEKWARVDGCEREWERSLMMSVGT